MSIIGRGKGRSAVACAAYRAGAVLSDDRYGVTHDYRRRKGIEATGIHAPEDAPEWTQDREQLWNRVEAAEKRKDAQLSREFVLAFHRDFDGEQRRELLDSFVAREVTSRDLVADWAIHAPNRKGDERNWHAHVMITMRSIGPEGFDEIKDRSLNTPQQLADWRAAWAEIQNSAFERYNIRDEQGQLRSVDHRSYEAQGLDKEPTLHLGVHATAMERRGEVTELGDINREVKQRNEARQMARRRAQSANLNEAFASDPDTSDEDTRRRIREALKQRHERDHEGHVPEP